jgi:tetratricopeptide (TPR) repeat protein
VAAVVCLVVGAVVVERLTRPAETPLLEATPEKAGLAFGQPASPPVDLSGPKPTAGQLIAEATRLADQLAGRYPNDPQALALAGQIYRAFGQANTAAECWKQGVQRDPSLVAAHIGLGEIALERGEHEEAEGHLRRAASLKRTYPGFNLRLAEAAMSLGKADEAVSLLEKAAQAGPLAPYDRFVLGQAYLLQGEHEKAKGQFESALAAEPRLANAHYGLARALRALGRTAEAEKHAEQYARLKKQDQAAISRYRSMSFGKDLADQGAPPLVASFYLQGAKQSAARGDAAAVERQLLRAAGICPQNPVCWEALDAFYRHQGRVEEADAVARQWKSLQETFEKK